MLFNSIDFAIFLPIVFLLYWLCPGKGREFQNVLILAASYFFYGWWDWRFLSLIIFSTLLDFFIGQALGKTDDKKKRRLLVTLSVTLNLGLLGVFKYLNFFIENFVTAFSFFGYDIPVQPLNLILPVGISFYTFQTISYTLDISKRKFEPTKDFIAFASFVSFFPQLVAGPIERASNLLPQFYKKRIFEPEKAVDGLRQMLWGLFKKVVIADSCADYVDMAFGNPGAYSASTLVLAAMLFPTQIYCDFSGYSDIAIGTARLFGINLNRNFAFPFFSTTVSELWRRWHISLYTWFRDYVFLPYVFKSKRKSRWVLVKATFIIFIMIGFWHGADWTFIMWGVLNAIYISIPIIRGKERNKYEFIAPGILIPGLVPLLRMISVYFLVSISAIMFRAEGVTETFDYLGMLFSISILSMPQHLPPEFIYLFVLYLGVEWQGRGYQFAIQKTGLSWPRTFRWLFYILLIFIIGMFIQTSENPFVYFNF